jgi:hypothetical protein
MSEFGSEWLVWNGYPTSPVLGELSGEGYLWGTREVKIKLSPAEGGRVSTGADKTGKE